LKRSRLLFIFAFAAFSSAAFLPNIWATRPANPQEVRHEKKHGFGVKQYEHFHDVLHPLEHEALPQKDFRRIRAKSAQLAKRGNAIVRLGVPRGTSEQNRPEFARELKKFSAALTRFRSDARRGTNDELKTSYSAVHDSFEMLAAMLPRG
jgi:hypothetical protein